MFFLFIQNVVEGVVHQEVAELPADWQVEEEDFSGVVLGAQVEEPQEVGLEAEGPADLEVAVVVVEVEVGLAVEDVEVGVSEGRSSAACKNLSSYCNSFAVYLLNKEKREK